MTHETFIAVQSIYGIHMKAHSATDKEDEPYNVASHPPHRFPAKQIDMDEVVEWCRDNDCFVEFEERYCYDMWHIYPHDADASFAFKMRFL